MKKKNNNSIITIVLFPIVFMVMIPTTTNVFASYKENNDYDDDNKYYSDDCFNWKYKYKFGKDGSFKWKYKYDYECKTPKTNNNDKNDKYGRDGFSYPEVTEKLSEKEYDKLVKLCAKTFYDMDGKPKECMHIEAINTVLSQKVRAEIAKNTNVCKSFPCDENKE